MTDYRVFIALIALTYLFLDPGSAHAYVYVHRVPEPATLTLLGVGAAALGGISLLRRRKKK